eukprot:COSAG06_NODE_28342_length_576_cov_0.857442_1_plen_145_part_01
MHGDRVRLVRHKTVGHTLVAKTTKNLVEFETELNMLRHCNNDQGTPYVVQLKDTDQAKQTMYFEHAKGGSLHDMIAEDYPNGMHETDAKSWARKALKALDYLHHQNIAHCDFKAENMLLFGPRYNILKAADLEGAKKIGDTHGML